MNLENLIKEYFPIITVCLSAFLAYVFSGRKYKTERFYNDIGESLKDFYSPVFHELRDIKLEQDPRKKENLLKEFVDKYTSNYNKLYICHNEYLVQLFYDLEQVFREYRLKRREKEWVEVCSIFNKINSLVCKEYWHIQRALYKDYPWQKVMERNNYLIKPFMRFLVLLYDTAFFLLTVWGILLYLIKFSQFTGQIEIPSIIKDNFAAFSSLTISLYSISFILAIPYLITVLDNRRISKLIEKADELIMNKLRKIFNKKNKINKDLPQMYIKKDIDNFI